MPTGPTQSESFADEARCLFAEAVPRVALSILKEARCDEDPRKLERALALVDVRRLESAAALFSESLEGAGIQGFETWDDAAALHVETLFLLGHHADVVATFPRWFGADQRRAMTAELVAVSLVKLGRLDEARTWALGLRQGWFAPPEVHWVLATLYERDGATKLAAAERGQMMRESFGFKDILFFAVIPLALAAPLCSPRSRTMVAPLAPLALGSPHPGLRGSGHRGGDVHSHEYRIPTSLAP